MHVETVPHRFVLVAPDRLFREALAARLTAAGMEVARTTWDIHDVPKDMLSRPGTILIVHVMEDDDVVFGMMKDVKSANPGIKVVVISRSGSAAIVAASLEIGVSTVLDENVSFDSFLKYLHFVGLSEQAVPISMVSAVIKSFQPYLNAASRTRGLPVALTPREKVILAYLTEGASNKHIARYLGIADSTVKVNVKSILRKINAANRTQAAVWGLQHDVRGTLVRDGTQVCGRSCERGTHDSDTQQPAV